MDKEYADLLVKEVLRQKSKSGYIVHLGPLIVNFDSVYCNIDIIFQWEIFLQQATMKKAVLVQPVVLLVLSPLSLSWSLPVSLELSGCVALNKSVAVKQQSAAMDPVECAAVCANYTLALIAPTPADASYISTTASVSAVPMLFYCACIKKMPNTAVNSTSCTLTCPNSAAPNSLCGGFDYARNLIAWSVYNLSDFTTVIGVEPLVSSSLLESIDPDLYPTDTSASSVTTSLVAIISTAISPMSQPLSTINQPVAVNAPESSTSTTASPSSASQPSWRALVIVCSLIIGSVFIVSLFTVLIHRRNLRARKIISSEAAEFDVYLNPSKQFYVENNSKSKIHHHNTTIAATVAMNDDFVEDHTRPSISLQRINSATATVHHHHSSPQIFTLIADIVQHHRPQSQTPYLEDVPEIPHSSVKIGQYIGAIQEEESSDKSISGRILSPISSSLSRIDIIRSKSVGSSSLSYRNDSLVGRGYQNSNTHASSLYMETIVQNDRIEFSSSNGGHSEDD
ncbi:hypothetical protein HK100_000430 [Physocladia obscura]|uniref:WSC domain-containing protein n=1 Tax=Physocladia obscura TaxID=109957 RepID=A0AAD5XGY7_9FUNG|nr:hypothetical protein HK100_000430 [Physocladia obscura]